MNKFFMGCLLVVVSIAGIESCRKPTFIGDELLPDEDQLNSTRVDTFSVITYTLLDDSAVTSGNLFYALGSMDQPDFGKTTANIYAQINLPTNNLTFGAGAEADSAVLILDYAGLYGDTTATHSVRVYRLIEPLYSDKQYYSDAKLNVVPFPIGGKSGFVPNINDSVTVDTITLQPHLRIKLDKHIADEIVALDSASLVNDSAFQNYFKGLYIEEFVDGGYSNSIMLFDLSTAICGINLYFHNTDFGNITATFPMTGVKTNYFTHDHTGSTSAPYLASPDTTLGNDITFVQGFTGMKTFVKIPTIANLQGVSINKAELVFTVKGDLDSVFPVPSRTVLLAADSLRRNSFIFVNSTETYASVLDQFRNGFDYGGALLTDQVNHLGTTQNIYKFDLTLEMQALIDGKLTNNGFALITYPGYRIPNGVILGGSSNIDPNLKPYLSVTYTYVTK